MIETKGLADLDVPHKDERAARWAVDASISSGVRWSYLRVDEDPFRQHEATLLTAQALLDMIRTRQRERDLAALDVTRESRSREQILRHMEAVREKMAGVTGVDEELRRMRDSSDG